MKTFILSIKKLLVLFGLGIAMTTYGEEEILLAQYTFDDGANTATNIAPNITFDTPVPFVGNWSTFSVEYKTEDSRDCLILWNKNNSLYANRGFVIPVTPDTGKDFVFTRMEITHKATVMGTVGGIDVGGNNAFAWIVDTYGSSTPNTYESNIYFFYTKSQEFRNIPNWVTTSYNLKIDNVENTYMFNSQKYIQFNMSCTSAASNGTTGDGGKWYVDDIKFYGYQVGVATHLPEFPDELNTIKVLDNGIEINVVQNALLEIYTSAGALVLKQEINFGIKNIDLSTGIYIARLNDGENCIVKKIVIK